MASTGIEALTTPHRHDRVDGLWQRGCRFLGTELAVLGGAMTWVSERHLVSAISNAGGFGVLACGSMGPERLAEEIAATAAVTDRPFGVNLIVMHPQLEQLADVCVAQGVGHVVLAGGLPPRETMERLKTGGAKVVCFAPSLALAKKLVRTGADALVIEGMEAGGHIGPVSTSVLAQEILPFLTEVPVFVAGGIGHGEMIAAYLQMGAAGVQMGTVFVCAEESTAHPAFKQAFIRGAARDAVPSVQIDPEFKVIPVRALANNGTRRFTETQIEVIGKFRRGEMTYQEASLAIEHYWAGALRRAVVDGDVENGSLMAGQSVGLVRKIQPVRAILAELVDQAEHALARRAESPQRALAAP
jgi:enoyl-[acyl-carrier protein] reductase II